MPPKPGGGGAGGKRRNQSVGSQPRPTTTTSGPVHVGKQPLAGKPSQSKFTIAPLILEGVKLNKLQLNDSLKQHLNDVRISDIQLSRTGIFTLYASDVSSFNRLLNDFTSILTANGQPAAKIYVPRSIQRIKDTEKVAFVKRVDLEIPDDRITDALKKVGLDAINVTRLNSKDGNTPTRTIKITFTDAQNRNTFVHTGLQVDSMHFPAEAASQNTKPVQCYICLKYNHVAKYCKTKQQICARCGEDHRLDQCKSDKDVSKCCNCKGNHLATSSDCSYYKEQEKKMKNMINQYSATNKPVTSAPILHDANEFPPLPNVLQQLQENDIFDKIINIMSSKMEKIIEETTSRLFKKLQQKIKKIEESIGIHDNNNDKDALTVSDSDSSTEESQVVKHLKSKQQQRTEAARSTTSSTDTSTKPTTTSKQASSKQTPKQKAAPTSSKRGHSLDSSFDSPTSDNNKNLKTSNNDD